MTPETRAFFDKAWELLANAETMLRVSLNEDAARTAYLAGYHAAQGVLFERTGKIFKTHSGVQSEFARFSKGDPRFDPDTRAFLGRTYEFKAIADYETGPDAKVSTALAAESIGAARRFVDLTSKILGR